MQLGAWEIVQMVRSSQPTLKRPEFIAQLLYKKPGMAACGCNLSTGWADTGGSWWLADRF